MKDQHDGIIFGIESLINDMGISITGKVELKEAVLAASIWIH